MDASPFWLWHHLEILVAHLIFGDGTHLVAFVGFDF
uniref:Uncharacterized protein n=1 Tax=Arundo donax TaxID=35708 RepID=A0A0A8ZW72_ARUDO